MLQGKAEGGSGVPLDRGNYEESVAFWDTHAAILWVKSLVANKMVAVLPGSDAFVTNLHSVLQ